MTLKNKYWFCSSGSHLSASFSITSHNIKYHFIFIQNLFPDINIVAVHQHWGRTFCLDFSVSRLVAFWDGLRPISCPERSELCSHADPCLGLNGQRSSWLEFFLVRNESLIELVLCGPSIDSTSLPVLSVFKNVAFSCHLSFYLHQQTLTHFFSWSVHS